VTNITAWGTDVEVLEGVDLLDKSELIGKPFLITGVWFETNKHGIEYAYVEGMFENGVTFEFNDSSSGVRAQLITYLEDRNRMPASPDEIVSLKLAIMKGLRVSTFEVVDVRGRAKTARTYYLTMSGAKPEAPKPAAKPHAKTAAAKN